MTDRPTLEDLDVVPEPARWCCNGNAEDCPLCTDPNPDYPWICPGHPDTVESRARVQAAAELERCCVCGGGPVVYRNYLELPFCQDCSNCQCAQNPCVRTGVNDPEVSGPASDAATEEVQRLRRAIRGIMTGNRRHVDRLTDAHQATIGQLRAAETRVQVLEAVLARVRALPLYDKPIYGDTSRGVQMGWDLARQAALDAIGGEPAAPAPGKEQS